MPYLPMAGKGQAPQDPRASRDFSARCTFVSFHVKQTTVPLSPPAACITSAPPPVRRRWPGDGEGHTPDETHAPGGDGPAKGEYP